VGYIGGGPLRWFPRILMGLSALLLIIPGTLSDEIGIVLYAALVVWQILKYRKIKKKAAESAAS
jgi:hypothetical protein